MCGIAGCIGRYAEEVVARMVRAMAHRGPDRAGIWSDPDVPATLGHRRLSILDLTAAGRQPMSYRGGRFWITYNGEVYNFRALRAELEGLGHQFISNTDTEVVLAAYAEWGPDCVRRFRGMFAFTLVDKAPRPGDPSAVLARDRLGIKPLLYCRHGAELWFASELQALIASGRLPLRLDPEGLSDFLAVGSVLQPRTILVGAKALPPGHVMELRGSEWRLQRYWDLHEETPHLRRELQEISEEEACERLKVLLAEATRYHLVSDVPVGAFLSGGIDSTAIVGLMGEIVQQPIKTFSVGFEEAHRRMDERPFARLAAEHLHADHHEVVVTAREAAEVFPRIVAAIDQPSIDGTNTWIVSRAASAQVKVALSGLGGDELFAGYSHFRWIAEDARVAPNGVATGRYLLRCLHACWPNRWTQRLLFRMAGPAERLAMLRRLLADADFERAVRPEWRMGEGLADRYRRGIRAEADHLQQTTYGEVNGYLVSTLLRDADVMSMAHGLEIRPVLLDHPLVEFAYALPAHHKLEGRETKRVLVQAVSGYLPPSLRSRLKMGFELPVVSWMGGELKPLFRALLGSEGAQRIFQARYLRTIREALDRDRPPRALWGWGILLSWLETHGVEVSQ